MGTPRHTGARKKSYSTKLHVEKMTTYGQIYATSSSNVTTPSQTIITQVAAKKTLTSGKAWTTVSLTRDIPAKLLQLQKLNSSRAHPAPWTWNSFWLGETGQSTISIRSCDGKATHLSGFLRGSTGNAGAHVEPTLTERAQDDGGRVPQLHILDPR